MLSRIKKLERFSIDEEKARINEIIFSFCSYIILVSKENANEHIKKKRNEENIKKKYNECVEEIKELNILTKKYNMSEIYEGDFEEESVKGFIKNIFDGMFENRTIRRK